MTKEKDDCQICLGAKGNTKGNENVIDGMLVCDCCHAAGPPYIPYADRRRSFNEMLDGLREKPGDLTDADVETIMSYLLDLIDRPWTGDLTVKTKLSDANLCYLGKHPAPSWELHPTSGKMEPYCKGCKQFTNRQSEERAKAHAIGEMFSIG